MNVCDSFVIVVIVCSGPRLHFIDYFILSLLGVF